MTTYYLWAEHTGGKSVGHPCTTGIYSDPTDHWQETVTADDEDDAQHKGTEALAHIATSAKPCDCHRHLSPGSQSWWDSVSIIASRTPFPNYTGDESVAE